MFTVVVISQSNLLEKSTVLVRFDLSVENDTHLVIGFEFLQLFSVDVSDWMCQFSVEPLDNGLLRSFPSVFESQPLCEQNEGWVLPDLISSSHSRIVFGVDVAKTHYLGYFIRGEPEALNSLAISLKMGVSFLLSSHLFESWGTLRSRIRRRDGGIRSSRLESRQGLGSTTFFSECS